MSDIQPQYSGPAGGQHAEHAAALQPNEVAPSGSAAREPACKPSRHAAVPRTLERGMSDEDDDELALDEMQSFACDINLSDSEGEALDWPGECAGEAAGGDDDDDDSGCGDADEQHVLRAAARQAEELRGSEVDGIPLALQPGVPMASRVEAMMSTEYWRGLCPQLHVSDPGFARKTARAVFNYVDDPDTVDELRIAMDRDGYVAVPAGTTACVSMSLGSARTVAHTTDRLVESQARSLGGART